MLTFQRVNKVQGIPSHYLPANLRPGRYKVLSVAVGHLFGQPHCVVGYVLAYRGKLVRAWLN